MQFEIPGVEKGLRPHPHVIADHAMAVAHALNVALRTDVDVVSDFKGFDIAKQRPRAYA